MGGEPGIRKPTTRTPIATIPVAASSRLPRASATVMPSPPVSKLVLIVASMPDGGTEISLDTFASPWDVGIGARPGRVRRYSGEISSSICHAHHVAERSTGTGAAERGSRRVRGTRRRRGPLLDLGSDGRG